MRYLYLFVCLLSIAAAARFGTQLTAALEGQKRQAQIAASRFTPPEGSRDASSPDQPPSGGADELIADSTSSTDIESSPDSIRMDDELTPLVGRSTARRHQAELHESMITPGNFEYVGAFRPPHFKDRNTSFGFGGWGIAFRPDGDANGPDDGFPGSIYLSGHRNEQLVAELSIPAPVTSSLRSLDALPECEVLQSFSDITDGLLAEFTAGSSEPFHLGGMIVTQDRLHWTMHKYYNVENRDYPSHGTSGLKLQSSIAEGAWHLGPMNSGLPEWNSYKHAGYIFEIPEAESKQWFGGHNLISGLQISTGLQASSQGPAMFAYHLPEEGTLPNSSLPAVPLCWSSEELPLPGHHPADCWNGGAWLTLGDKQAVVIVGRKSLGEYYYGEARPTDCTPDKGYHGTPYEFQILFYSPASLIHAAHGSTPASSVQPWMRWTGQSEGGGPGQYLANNCSKLIGGLAYDREHNLLYLSQIEAGVTSDNEYEPLPVIQVFRIVE